MTKILLLTESHILCWQYFIYPLKKSGLVYYYAPHTFTSRLLIANLCHANISNFFFFCFAWHWKCLYWHKKFDCPNFQLFHFVFVFALKFKQFFQTVKFPWIRKLNFIENFRICMHVYVYVTAIYTYTIWLNLYGNLYPFFLLTAEPSATLHMLHLLCDNRVPYYLYYGIQ